MKSSWIRNSGYSMFNASLNTLLVLVTGCGSVELSQPLNSIDLRAQVVAVICPDTVEAGQQFTVEIGYPNVCGGTFDRLEQSEGTNTITFGPILRVSPEVNCPGVYPLETVSRNITIGTVGDFAIVAQGLYGDIRKPVAVVSSVPRDSSYRLIFYFIHPNGEKNTGLSTRFWFPDRNPDESRTVQSDTSGYWELGFADTSAFVRYGINGMIFTAQAGIKESGILLFP